MKPWPPAVAGAANWASDVAYPPPPQLDENAASPLLIARSDPIADASLPDMRARSSPGTAIAAMMPMIATTISSSMRVKPLALRIFFINDSVGKGLLPAADMFMTDASWNRNACADQ